MILELTENEIKEVLKALAFLNATDTVIDTTQTKSFEVLKKIFDQTNVTLEDSDLEVFPEEGHLWETPCQTKYLIEKLKVRGRRDV